MTREPGDVPFECHASLSGRRILGCHGVCAAARMLRNIRRDTAFAHLRGVSFYHTRMEQHMQPVLTLILSTTALVAFAAPAAAIPTTTTPAIVISATLSPTLAEQIGSSVS